MIPIPRAPAGGGGGITALTGDVVASGTGSVAATVVQQYSPTWTHAAFFAAPNSGELRANDVSSGLTSAINFHIEPKSSGGVGPNLKAVLMARAVGSQILLTNQHTDFTQAYQITSVTDNTTFVTFGVTPIHAGNNVGWIAGTDYSANFLS